MPYPLQSPWSAASLRCTDSHILSCQLATLASVARIHTQSITCLSFSRLTPSLTPDGPDDEPDEDKNEDVDEDDMEDESSEDTESISIGSLEP